MGRTNKYIFCARSFRKNFYWYLWGNGKANATINAVFVWYDAFIAAVNSNGGGKSVWRLESESRKESEKHTQKKKPNAFQILMKFSYLDGKISVSTPKHTATTHICHESECCLMKTSANTNTEIKSKIVYESNWQREMLNVECSKDKN